jgi:multicomponent Na+:H+ antiporter subunit B
VRFPFGNPVLDAAARLLVPFVLLFAVYVVVHGHSSPGGGFQGGVLLAAGLLLVKLIRGRPGRWDISTPTAVALTCIGVALFAGIGIASLAFGGAFLDYAAPGWLADSVSTRVLGTFGIEVGVALTVMGVILVVFDTLSGWGEAEG